MATRQVLNNTRTAIVINSEGRVLGGRESYAYDEDTITPSDFAIIRKHVDEGRLIYVTSGVAVPSPSGGATVTKVAVEGTNLVVTDSLGGKAIVPLPSVPGGSGGSVDLTGYAKITDVVSAVGAKADAAAVYDRNTIDGLVGSKAEAGSVYSKAQVDTMLAAAAQSSMGGNKIILVETPTGYCLPGTTSPVTTPASDKGYEFNGYPDPPFFRAQDLHIKIDRGIVPVPVTVSLLSSDDFDAGKNATPAAATGLDTTHWGGEVTFYRQSSDGNLVPNGWSSTAKTYFIGDKTQAPAPRMRAEMRITGYSSTNTQRTLRVLVNVTNATVPFEQVTGYGVIMDTTSTGANENWTVARIENGSTVATIGTFTQARSSAPRRVEFDSNGRGSLTVTVDGVILNGGKPFVDPSTTPLVGRYAGISGYGQGSSAAASMNAKADMWRFYA